MNPEAMTGLFGVIAIILVGALVWIKKLQSHRQIKKSVRPQLVMERNLTNTLPLRITCTNKGLGPAYIQKIDVHVDGLCFTGLKSFTDALNKVGLKTSDVIFYTPAYDECLEINAKSVLLEANPLNNSEHERILKAVSKINFRIEYASIYGEEFVLSE